jgi:DNA-binding NarL/FixJ family response regulator
VKIRVFICDDHELFREGVKSILREDATLEVVGEASDGRQGWHEIVRLQPDVVLMDMEMPEMDGLEATRRIHQQAPRVKVLILTMYSEDEIVSRCLDAGAVGYVLKDTQASQLVYAIKEVHKGGRYMSPSALRSMVDHYVRGTPRTQSRYDSLTDREREVLKLLADGLSVKEIAAKLEVSLKTVDVHKTNLMRKLDVHDRVGLIRYALQNKLVRLPVMK